MSVTHHYNPNWDTARGLLPDRVYEDDDIILASTFECGNGFHFRRLPDGRYALDTLMECSVEQPAPPDVDYYVPTLDALWDAFGEDRLVYGSNWPVCERAGTYHRCIDMVRAYFARKSEVVSEKFFWKNSQAFYGWKERKLDE